MDTIVSKQLKIKACKVRMGAIEGVYNAKSGHAAPAYYSVLAHRGYFPVEELKTLRKSDSRLQGHPNMRTVPGVDASTGSLGQGISVAVGMALGAKLSGKSFRVYTILGDGEIQEGQVWEAAMYACAKGLDNLVAVVDNNNLQIDGTIAEVNSPYPINSRLSAGMFLRYMRTASMRWTQLSMRL